MLTKNKQGGVGLVEVLVALFLVSTSLVSMAKIIHYNLMDQSNIYNKTTATLLVNDLIERIKTNPSQNYAIEKIFEGPDIIDVTCELGQCSAMQLKKYDINQWLFLVFNQLPNAIAVISKDANKYRIKLQWSGFYEHTSGNKNKIEVEFFFENT